MRKGIMALEGLDEEVVAVAEPMDFVDAPENDMIEMNAVSDEISDTEDSIEEAGQTAEVLTEVQTAMGDSLEKGGMSETDIACVMPAVEHMLARLSFDMSKKKVFPAMEAFGKKETRIQATKIAMETIGEYVTKIWEAIKATFARIWESLKTFWSHLTDASKKYAARAKSIVSAADAAKKSNSSAKDGSSVKAGSVFAKAGVTTGFQKYLMIDGKMPTDFYTLFNKHSGEAAQIATNIFNDSNETVNLVTKSVTLLKEGKIEEADSAMEQANETFKQITGLPKSTSKEYTPPTGFYLVESPLHFGNKAFFAYAISGDGKNTGNATNMKAWVADATGSKAPEKLDETIKVLSLDEVKGIANTVNGNMTALQKMDSVMKTLDASIKKSMNVTIDKLVQGNVNKVMMRIRFASNNVSAMVTGGVSKVRSYELATNKAALDYCAASLKQYGAGEPAAAEKPLAIEK